MPDTRFEIDLKEWKRGHKFDRQIRSASGARSAFIQPLDHSGKAIGPPRRAEIVRARPVEVFDSQGHRTTAMTATKIRTHARMPRYARRVELRIGSSKKIMVIPPPPPPPPPLNQGEFESIPHTRNVRTGDWILLILSDSFSDRGKFIGHCEALANHIRQQAPFNEVGIREHVEIHAYFTGARNSSIFNVKSKQERIWQGEPKDVKKYVKKRKKLTGRYNQILVLTNQQTYGGAGETQNDNIAWASPSDTTKDGQTTAGIWLDVAMHEIGHNLDLADEYEHSYPEWFKEKYRFKGMANWEWWLNHCDNVFKQGQACPWIDDIDPKFHNTIIDADTALGHAGQLGVFEGAYYNKKGYFRPFLTCKMREVRDSFCPQCQKIIRSHFH